MAEDPQASTSGAMGALLEPGTEVGGYVVDAKIGEGGMGMVYGATQPRIGKRVAIKVLSAAYCGDPATVERFEQEARLVNEIGHPNIVDVFQFGELADGRSFFVMEFLEGEPLTARIDRSPLSAGETMEILDVVCDALSAAHDHGVVHRDLKSDNVFLATARGKQTVKLLDFGLAKLASRDPTAIGKTKSGIVVGTPAYMSPEQARAKAVDHRTDIYALGVLAYKMLTGKLPFNADNAIDLIVQQLDAPPPSPANLAPKTPAVLSKLVLRMMAKAPADRPSLADVRALFAELGGRATAKAALAKAATAKATPAKASKASREPAISEDREPAFARAGKPGAARAPTPEPVAEEAPAKRRVPPILFVVLIALAAGIGVVAVALMRKGDAAAPAETPATGSSAPAATAPPATPTTAPATPDIDFDQPGSAVAGSAAGSAAEVPAAAGSAAEVSGAGSADPAAGSAATRPPRHHHRPDVDSTGAVTEPTDTPDDDAAVVAAPKPGAIILTLEHASTIQIDGAVVATNSKGGRFDVAAGHHEIVIKADDRQSVSRSVDLESGGTAIMNIADGQATAPPPPEPEHPPAPAPAP